MFGSQGQRLKLNIIHSLWSIFINGSARHIYLSFPYHAHTSIQPPFPFRENHCNAFKECLLTRLLWYHCSAISTSFSSTSCPIDFALGHETCFGQWDVKNCDTQPEALCVIMWLGKFSCVPVLHCAKSRPT